MIRLKSLQQRFLIFMMLPVMILLTAMGLAGFTYARDYLLTQWGESTVLKLQRAAHHVDMRLSKPKDMLALFHNSAGLPHAWQTQGLILDQLEKLEWVKQVNLTWSDEQSDKTSQLEMHHHVKQRTTPNGLEVKETIMVMPFHKGDIVAITPPIFDSPDGSGMISLISNLKDEKDQTIAKLEVEIRFDYLFDTVEATGWWQDHKAFLVDEEGNILTRNFSRDRKKLSENNDSLETSIMYRMKSSPFGAVFGQGFPPEEVSGFYNLQEAPWTLVIIVPGSEILSPIVKFRLYYFTVGGFFIVVILFLIRFVTGRTTSSIKKVSHAAKKVSLGDYDVSLPVKTRDEVGELSQSFNTMVTQLEERAQLKYSLNLAKEVQQNLLPNQSIQNDYLDIEGQSIYCDETGGDYYDFLEFSELGEDRIGIVVGDVSGHGIAAALFMTTARALIRSRVVQRGNLSQVITDVNRLLCMDTADNGNFMTLFFMTIDVGRKEIQWVRAGHDPAILYDTVRDEFRELGGKGVALGVNEEWSYEEYARGGWNYGQIVLIGTDGIWETENQQGELFGKDRLREILRRYSHAPAAKILQAVNKALVDFRQEVIQSDDITLVVIKAKS